MRALRSSIANFFIQLISYLLFAIDLNGQIINLISWNIQDCGQTKSDEEIQTIANIIRDADIVAIQEVVAKHPGGAQSIGRLGEALNRMGAKWDYRISDPTISPVKGQSERYAFLWKTSVLDMIHRPFLDSALAAEVIREPFIGRFRQRSNQKQFVMVNFHSRRFDEHPEEEVKYFYAYPKRFDVPVIIAGDFNMSEDEAVFDGLYKLGYHTALLKQKTTLKKTCDNGAYLNHAIDNIYVPAAMKIQNGGVVDFVKKCGSLEYARTISDHLPVRCTISY